MENMEIERKYLVKELPEDYRNYPKCEIEQGYLCTNPVIRIRKENDSYYLTYKSTGFLARQEYNLPLTPESYEHLKKKSDGCLIKKTRYLIPYSNYTIELDLFHGTNNGLLLAEVEFASQEEATSFSPPDWFLEDVTFSETYQNCNLIH